VPRSTKDLLIEAFRTGHAWNPALPNLHNADEGRIKLMNGTEKDAKDLLRSRQSYDINFDTLMSAIYIRFPPDPDKLGLYGQGDDGPALQQLVDLPRCPLPDFAPPPNASFHYDDPDLQKAVESMQAAAASPPISGPYWRGCDSQRPDVHSLVIGINTKEAPSNFLANQDKILAARRAMAAEIGVAVRFVINPQSMEGLQQYQVYRGMGGSIIGTNYFPQTNSCGRIPNGSMSSSYNPSNWQLHANLGTHESEGHGLGFNHVRGGTMNSSIVLSPLTWINDPAWSQVIRYYPAKPLEPDQPPPPPPPPTSQRVYLKANEAGSLISVVGVKDFSAKKDEVIDTFQLKPYRP
jgi:hypothetical protein